MAKKTKAELAEIEESRAELALLLNPKNVRRDPDDAAIDIYNSTPDYQRRYLVDLDSQSTIEVKGREVSDYLPTLYLVIESVARSGMSRTMRVYVLDYDSNGRPYMRWITAHVARVCGFRMVRGWKDCLRIDGNGMDMTFALANSLCHAVFGYGPTALNANHYRRDTL